MSDASGDANYAALTPIGSVHANAVGRRRHASWAPVPAIVGEAIQHAIEFRFGMYVQSDGISSGLEANVRLLAAGKVIGFLVTLVATGKSFAVLLLPDRHPTSNQISVLAAIGTDAITSKYFDAFVRPTLSIFGDAPMLRIARFHLGLLAPRDLASVDRTARNVPRSGRRLSRRPVWQKIQG